MVFLQEVNESEKHILHNIMQFYIYEFSKYIPAIKLEANGAYEPFKLDRYWESENHHPFFIKLEDELIGFILVESSSALGPNTIKEFFIMAKHNGLGHGKEAARELFKRFPGKWEITQIENNKRANYFWRTVINEVSKGKFTERHDEGKYIQTFSTANSETGSFNS